MRDTVKHLIELFEFGRFVVYETINEMGFYQYVAYYTKVGNYGQVVNELLFDGIGFKMNGDSMYVQLTSKERKAIYKAFEKAIDEYILTEGDCSGFDELQDFLNS